MNILITGTTGFVGKYLKAALQQQYNIIEINRDKQPNSFTFDELNLVLCQSTIWIHLAGLSKDISGKKLLPYLKANTQLTEKVFNAFLEDNTASVFIYVSSVKAVASEITGILTEEEDYLVEEPYGFSKRKAEKYLLSVKLPANKKLIILRPAMIYGYNKKGNLYSLFSFIKKGLPYPFAAFDSLKTMLSVDNFIYVIRHIIENKRFQAGIYNVADDDTVSITDIIKLMSVSLEKKIYLWKINKNLIIKAGIVGDYLHLPINTLQLNKLTKNYIVSNQKLRNEIGSKLPYSTKSELVKLFKTFSDNNKAK